MEQALKDFGFKFIGTCNCHGRYNHKYKFDKYLVYWAVKKDEFKLKKNGVTIKNYTNVSEFEKYFSKESKIPFN